MTTSTTNLIEVRMHLGECCAMNDWLGAAFCCLQLSCMTQLDDESRRLYSRKLDYFLNLI